MAHTDISPGQFIKVNGIFKLNDFNRARFLPWSAEKNQSCPYFVGSNPGKYRSPEEYNYEGQTEMVSELQHAIASLLVLLLFSIDRLISQAWRHFIHNNRSMSTHLGMYYLSSCRKNAHSRDESRKTHRNWSRTDDDLIFTLIFGTVPIL